MRLFVVVAASMVAGSLLAGCAADQDDTAATSPGGGSPRTFLVIEPGPTCLRFCEPVVAVGLDGRVFVKANTYARSTADGGFEEFQPPALPSGMPPGSFQTDRHIQVGPDGTLWFSTLIGSFQQAVFFLLGVQVGYSEDAGDTWASSFLPFDGATPADSVGADRQWLAVAPDGRVHITFQQNSVATAFTSITPAGTPNAANIWEARSDDRGASWSGFQPVDALNPLADQATGQPVVLSDGTLVVPFQRYPEVDSPVAPFGFALGISAEGGPFRQAEVAPGGAFFPALVEVEGGFVAAHMDDSQTLTWAFSGSLTDWPEFTPLGDTGEMLSSPWLGVRPDGRWDLVWLERTPGTDDQIDILHSAAGAPGQMVATGLVGQPTLRANTDFAHAAYLDGRLLIVSGDGETERSLLFLEPV